MAGLIIIGYVAIIILMLEISLGRLYRIAYDLVPENERTGCQRTLFVQWPWSNQECGNAKLRQFSEMCFRIYLGSLFFGLLLPFVVVVLISVSAA